MQFKSHLLSYVLVPLCVLAIAASFYRFVVVGDYIVEYEGACDPATESCFFACDSEECAEVYYYTWVQKRNVDVRAQCGVDVTDCEAASMCLPSDRDCSIAYCDPEVNECVGPGVVVGEEEGTEVEETEEEADPGSDATIQPI